MQIRQYVTTVPVAHPVESSKEAWESVEWLNILGIFGNVRVREFGGRRGQVLPGHKHNYAHAEAIVKGAGLVRFTHPDGVIEERKITAPEIFEVPADVIHEVEVYDDMVAWCIFAMRDKDTREIVDFVTEENERDLHAIS